MSKFLPRDSRAHAELFETAAATTTALVPLPTRRAKVDAAAVGGLEDDPKDKWPSLRMSLLA
jgi:hypothetical protein